MRAIDLLKTKDDMIRFRCPSEVKRKLEIDAERLGITASKLSLGILAIFLNLEPKEQKALLEGRGYVAVVKRAKSVPIERVPAKKSSGKKGQR